MVSIVEEKDMGGRLRFANIDAATRDTLREVWPTIEAALPPILARFYEHLRREPKMGMMVGDRQGHLESAQTKHWARLFKAAFDED